MNEPAESHETEKHDEEIHVEEKPHAPLPTSVVVLGFIAIVLVGMLIASVVRSRPADTADAGDDPALREAKAKIQLLQSSVNQERAKLGLSPLYGETRESAEAVAARITDDAATLVALAKGVQTLIIDKDAELAQRTKEVTEAVKLQNLLREKLTQTEAELNRALIEGSDSNALRAQLESANQRVVSLGDEVRRLADVPAELQARLREVSAERDVLAARVAELESKISQMSLFAGTEAEMFEEAIELFRRLRELENKSDSEVATAYSQFGTKLGANVLDKIDFPTGSAEVRPEDEMKIPAFADEAPENALLIVIGYASESGDVDSNRILSSNRATAVARVLDAAKRPGQRVQAAYLGQTDRFGSRFPERNQICEVWQIVPRD